MIFCFYTEERSNVLLLTLSCDKVVTTKGEVTKTGFPITLTTCIAGIRVGIQKKMMKKQIMMITSKRMFEIYPVMGIVAS